MNWRTPLTLLSAVALCSLGLSGCGLFRGPARGGSAIDPHTTAVWCGQPTALSATLLLKSIDIRGDSTLVTLRLWRAADGRTRLLVTKIDVEVLQLLITSDGKFTAYAPRSGLHTAGDFNAATLPAGLADLRLLISEVADGPLAFSLVPHLSKSSGANVAHDARAHDNILVGPVAADVVATVTLAPDSDEVREKILRDAHGNLLYQLRYRDYRAYDDFHRPSKVDGVVADGSSLTAYLRSFEALGDISPERMRLTIPATARAVAVTEFLEHLDQ